MLADLYIISENKVVVAVPGPAPRHEDAGAQPHRAGGGGHSKQYCKVREASTILQVGWSCSC